LVLLKPLTNIVTMKIAVLDIETTGFITTFDAIVEIGITVVDTKTGDINKIYDKVILDPLFDEKRHKIAWVFGNSDLTTTDVLNGIPLEDTREELQKIFDTYPITAHNKSFDLRFLRSRNFEIKDIKCLMKSCRENKLVYTHKGSPKSPSVEEAYHVLFPEEEYIEKHRGGDDSLHEGKILLKLCEIKAGKFKPTPIKLTEEYEINKRRKKIIKSYNYVKL
jgi:DNA polymerase III alpha subunit (gram-positive type)